MQTLARFGLNALRELYLECTFEVLITNFSRFEEFPGAARSRDLEGMCCKYFSGGELLVRHSFP